MKYCIGSRWFNQEGQQCVLSEFDRTETSTMVCLICVDSGNRWSDPVSVEMNRFGVPKISKDDFDLITGGSKFSGQQLFTEDELVLPVRYEFGTVWTQGLSSYMLSKLDHTIELDTLVGLVNLDTGVIEHTVREHEHCYVMSDQISEANWLKLTDGKSFKRVR